ncbi:MAG: phosphopantetheine-binding protein [bacterium]
MKAITEMTRFEMETAIMDCITKKLRANHDNPPALSLESSLSKDLGLDSLDIIELVQDLEIMFDISLSVIDPVDTTQTIDTENGKSIIRSGDLCVKHLADMVCQQKVLLLETDNLSEKTMM